MEKYDGHCENNGIKIWITVQKDSIIPEFDMIKGVEWEGPEDKYSKTVMKMATENMFLEDALKLRPIDILNAIGEEVDPLNIPKIPIIQVLKETIHDYFIKTDQKERFKKATEVVVCRCYNVTNHDIESAIKMGKKTFEELQKFTGCGTGCASCGNQVKKMLQDECEKE